MEAPDKNVIRISGVSWDQTPIEVIEPSHLFSRADCWTVVSEGYSRTQQLICLILFIFFSINNIKFITYLISAKSKSTLRTWCPAGLSDTALSPVSYYLKPMPVYVT